MDYSYSYTLSKTFTRTSARYIASKVVADLRLMQIYYGQPSDEKIIDYFSELTEFLAYGSSKPHSRQFIHRIRIFNN